MTVSLLQVSELGQKVGPAYSLMDAGGTLNIHSLLSKNRDKVTDLMLHLVFWILLFY